MRRSKRYGLGDINRRRKRVCGENCVYCGAWATTEDHFPPAMMTSRGWLLPACKECNSIIGTKEPFDILKRRELVAVRFRRKLARMKGEWLNSEIETELTGNLQRSVASYQNERRNMAMRAKWSVEAYLAIIAPDECHKIIGHAEGALLDDAA